MYGEWCLEVGLKSGQTPGQAWHGRSGKQLRIHYKCREKPLEISRRVADCDLTKRCSLKITLAIIVMNGLKEVRIGRKKKRTQLGYWSSLGESNVRGGENV